MTEVMIASSIRELRFQFFNADDEGGNDILRMSKARLQRNKFVIYY